MKKRKQNEENQFLSKMKDLDNKVFDHLLTSLEDQLDYVLEGKKLEIIDKAHLLLVHIDVNQTDPISCQELDKRFSRSIIELYNDLIIYDSVRFCSIMKKLLNVQQKVYVIESIKTSHFIYLINQSLDEILN